MYLKASAIIFMKRNSRLQNDSPTSRLLLDEISDIALFFHSDLYGLKLFSFEKLFQMCTCFYYQRQVYIYPQNVRVSLCPGTGAQ